MNLEIKFKDNYSAEGEYTIWADCYDTAELYWADCNGVLPEWKEGNVVELRIMEKALEVRMRTIHTRKWISRGYYFISL